MAGSLPLFAALNTTRQSYNHLRYDEREDGNMWFINTPDVPMHPTTKFGIERSSSNNQLVHIRSCYSNKYLVRESSTSRLINAASDEPQEDASDWACTLFRPNRLNNDQLEFVHVQTGVHAVALNAPSSGGLQVYRLGINLDNPTSTTGTRMRVADWDTFVILPKQVTFKGDNDRYLVPWRRANTGETNTHNFRFSGSDPAAVSVPYEVMYVQMYYIRIKSLDPDVPPSAPFWTDSNNRPVFNNRSTVHFYMPIKLSDNQIALDFYGVGIQFGRRAPEDNNALYFNAPSIVREARFEVGEPVLSREVYNVNFRLDHARIYNRQPLVLATFPATNDSSHTHFRTVTFHYEERRERFWRGFVSLNLGVRMRLRAGIPLLGATITISANFDSEYEWGETVTETISLTDQYSFPIPPMTRAVARMLATRATCDVPFSYTVRDLLTNGRTSIYEVDGGVYTGVNNFEFKVDVEYTPL